MMRIVYSGYIFFLLLLLLLVVVVDSSTVVTSSFEEKKKKDDDDDDHHLHKELPNQLNVYNDPFCQVDDENGGFGGSFSETSFRIHYYQEIEFLSTTTTTTTSSSSIIENIVRDLELSIVNLLLKSNHVLCSSHNNKEKEEKDERLLVVSLLNSTTKTTTTTRKIVGISANPDDQVLESCKFFSFFCSILLS